MGVPPGGQNKHSAECTLSAPRPYILANPSAGPTAIKKDIALIFFRDFFFGFILLASSDGSTFSPWAVTVGQVSEAHPTPLHPASFRPETRHSETLMKNFFAIDNIVKPF